MDTNVLEPDIKRLRLYSMLLISDLSFWKSLLQGIYFNHGYVPEPDECDRSIIASSMQYPIRDKYHSIASTRNGLRSKMPSQKIFHSDRHPDSTARSFLLRISCAGGVRGLTLGIGKPGRSIQPCLSPGYAYR